jgi:RNA polymerase sigma-70 factor (ECF subfamily)
MAEPVDDARQAWAESERLARRAASGDRSAQRELFQQLKRRLHATLYRIMGSNEAMEDLLQDTFIEVFRSLPSYRGESQLGTWADRIAIRVAYRHIRHTRARKRSAPPVAGLTLVGAGEADMLHREGVRRLYRVLSDMSPEYRTAFALFVVDGRSLREVADAVGISLVAAKSRVWRARRQVMAAARDDGVLARYLSQEKD